MENEFNLIRMQKKGMAKGVYTLVGVVVLLILIGSLAPSVLSGLFNTSMLYVNGNSSLGNTGVPSWTPIVLGILGVVAFIFIMLKAVEK